MQPSPEQATLIRASFRSLEADLAGATDCFYRALFHIAPDLRGLFVADVEAQGRKLAETLRVVVDLLDQWGKLVPVLAELGQRHVAYGVRIPDYKPVNLALRLMLAERLGPDYTAEADAAWTAVLAEIESVMMQAATRGNADPDLTGPYLLR